MFKFLDKLFNAPTSADQYRGVYAEELKSHLTAAQNMSHLDIRANEVKVFYEHVISLEAGYSLVREVRKAFEAHDIGQYLQYPYVSRIDTVPMNKIKESHPLVLKIVWQNLGDDIPENAQFYLELACYVEDIRVDIEERFVIGMEIKFKDNYGEWARGFDPMMPSEIRSMSLPKVFIDTLKDLKPVNIMKDGARDGTWYKLNSDGNPVGTDEIPEADREYATVTDEAIQRHPE